VLNIGCKNLENVVELGELDSPEVNKLLLKYLKKIKNSNIDQVVLGCTHYPFLKKHIQKIVGQRVNLLDSGDAIARRVKFLLETNSTQNNLQKRNGGKNTLYFTTGDPKKFSKVASKLLKKTIVSKKVKI